MVNKITNLVKKAKSVLVADPNLLYEGDRHLINEPFFFQGGNGKAVLLIHGWTATPYEVRRLGMYLNENGYTASGPMLRGHGTTPKDLEGVKWTDWIKNIEASYDELKKNHEKVYIAGTSIGGSLALILAKKKPDISGLVLMATPYKIKIEKIVILFAKLSRLFKKYNRKYYPPTFGLSTTITRLIAYQTYPIDSALETFNLVKKSRENLGEIKQPCFVIQSSSDHVVARKSLENIYNKISSQIKEKKYIKRAYHTFISDIKNERVFEDILNFIKNN